MTEPADQDQDQRTRWQVFTSWHRTESLWRELYARTASALAAALVIYVVAAIGGLVPLRSLSLVAACMCGFAAGGLLTYTAMTPRDPGRVWRLPLALVLLAASVGLAVVWVWVRTR